MLHRAATNAYSWWWASHIRTKQSKWLEQNLVDMEGMVQSMMKIIDQEGDSFVKRVEMYYKKRPELIHFVEESYRAYRALAERYDHLSKDLQNANRTIATAFPEQIQLSMESYDDTSSHESVPPSPDHSLKTIPIAPKNLPRLPRIPQQFLKGDSALAAKKEQLRRTASNLESVVPANSSGLTKEEAAKEIDVLQKDILAMQTEKEFLKSSYETGMTKFWEIEGKISEFHARVYNLQDEFGIGTVIEDHEAKSLMATAALSSCSEALSKIQERQETSTSEVKGEYARIKEAHERLESLKKHVNQEQEAVEPRSFDLITGEIELEEGDSLREKIREKLNVDSNVALTEPELADRIDELVQKIVVLETTVFSQNGLLKRIRQYTDELLQHISSLEDNTETIAHNEDYSKRVLELEEELSKVKSLNQDLLEKKNNLNAELAEANINLDHLMETAQQVEDSAKDEPEVEAEAKPEKEVQHKEMVSGCNDMNSDHHHEHEEDDQEKTEQTNIEVQDTRLEGKEGINWRKMYTTNIEERERIFVEEYTVILRDYKDNKVKLSEVEKKNREYIFELTSLARELRNTIVSKDEEIKLLLTKLNALQHNNNNENVDLELDGFATPKGKHHERSASADESRTPWGTEPDKKPLFHHLYDPKTGIIARNTSAAAAAESPPRKRDPLADSPRPMSRVQARLRTELNNVLEGNLEFWLRFSTSFHLIQKFEATIKDLKSELSKLRDSRNNDNKLNLQAVQSDARPLYKHLREIQTEMTLWMEHSTVFQDELRTRFLSLNNIQEEISKLLVAGKRIGDPELSDFQAAKFQGEILNMKQENNKVEDELQAGIRKVKELKKETEKVLAKMDKEFKLSENKSTSSRSKIPLHTILFGMKLKKNKHKNLALES